MPFTEYPVQQATSDAVAGEMTAGAAARGSSMTVQVQWDIPHAVDLVVVWSDDLPPAESVPQVSALLRKAGGDLLRWEEAAVWPQGGYPWQPAVLLLPWLANTNDPGDAAAAPRQVENAEQHD